VIDIYRERKGMRERENGCGYKRIRKIGILHAY
jgi:hypothetical protein